MAAVGASVLMHVCWNLIARHETAGSEPLWWVLLGHLVLLGSWSVPLMLQQLSWSGAVGAALLGSTVGNALYFIGLQRAYRLAPVAMVYPLVRSSPLLIALWAVLLLGERLNATTWLGIAVSVAALLWMTRSARTSGGTREAGAVKWAMVSMVSTSVYSLTDHAAVSHLADFAGVMGYLTIGYFASWLALTLQMWRETGRWRPALRPRWGSILVGSLCIGVAYALKIDAMRVLPAAEAVAYSNAGIVLATLLSITVFGERQGWRARLAGAVVLTIGLIIIAAGRLGLWAI